VVELDGVGKQHPLSMEKLSPVLALYWVKDFAAGMNICESLLRFGGLGHTCAIYGKDDARIREYAQRMPANRVLVNTPAPQGSTGITTNVFPSMTLGCGAAAGNITSDNVGPQHLYNIKRLAYAVRTPAEAFETPVGQSSEQANVPPAAATYIAAPKIATDIVDRFLARRGAAPQAPVAPAAAPAPAPVPAPAASCAACAAPAPPKPQTVDFVCEEDVRIAIKQSRKIYIGPKTIVTPSARDLASPSDILVLV
jgi:acetaldehyde dehydrogenase (acetylating)